MEEFVRFAADHLHIRSAPAAQLAQSIGTLATASIAFKRPRGARPETRKEKKAEIRAAIKRNQVIPHRFGEKAFALTPTFAPRINRSGFLCGDPAMRMPGTNQAIGPRLASPKCTEVTLFISSARARKIRPRHVPDADMW